MNLKPQDLLVVLKLVCGGSGAYGALAGQLGMSASEVHAAVKRAAESGLVDISDPENRKIQSRPLYEFLIHGVPRSFPVKPGPIVRGIPTAHATAPLSSMIVSRDDLPPVWPDADGKTRGYKLSPIYRSAPEAAKRDPQLYELLALVDALRAGRARERKAAAAELRHRLLPEEKRGVRLSPFGVTESDLDTWSDSRTGSESVLPDLIRRLVLFLVPRSEILAVNFPAHKAINQPGFDGELTTLSPTVFAGTGASVWELSTSREIQLKANRDYADRTQDPEGRDKSATTYIALTSHIWREPAKSKWLRDRQAENAWADVRVYDAVDIAQWLAQAPSVHAWFASAIGRPLIDIDTVDDYFGQWAARTAPGINESTVLAGRDQDRGKVEDWLRAPSRTFVAESDTVEESVVFLCSVIRSAGEPERSDWASRIMIMHSQEAWKQTLKSTMAKADSPIVLVPAFSGYDGVLSSTESYCMFFPREGAGQSDGRDSDIVLGPIPREPLAGALRGLALPHSDPRKLAYESGGKLSALQRLLGYTPRVPEWATDADPEVLSALLLVGAWEPVNSRDAEMLAHVAGCMEFRDIEQNVTRLMSVTDPPLRRQGQTIKWRSRVDVWRLIGKHSLSVITRFCGACAENFNRASPMYDLPPSERAYAPMQGAVLPESGTLREGMAVGLAWLRRDAEKVSSVMRAGDVRGAVDNVVREVLKGDWRTWATLDPQLPDLAEAAPSQFLLAVESAIAAPSQPLGVLFRQDDRKHGFLAGCCHAGLLWALEALAWNPDYYARVVDILAQLCEIDVGGQYANRPKESLPSLFHPLVKQTAASNQQRIKVLGSLYERKRHAAWLVVCSVLKTCSHPCTIDINYRPRHSDWELPEELTQYSPLEISEYLSEIRAMAYDLIRDDFTRLDQLFERGGATALIPDLFDHIGENTSTIRREDGSYVRRIQSHLRKWVSYQHLSAKGGEPLSPDLEKAQALIRDLDPDDSVARMAWLFSQQVTLPDESQWDDDWRNHDNRVEQLRGEAITGLLAEPTGFERVLALSEEASDPGIVGATLAMMPIADEYEDLLIDGPLIEEGNKRKLGLGFVAQRSRTAGVQCLIALANRLASDASPTVAADVLASLPSWPDVRDWVELQEEGVRMTYWLRVSMVVPVVRDGDDFSRIVKSLLACRRWSETIELARWDLHGDNRCGCPADYVRILEHGVTNCSPEEWERGIQHHSTSYVIPRIFSLLDESGDVSTATMVGLEIRYLDLLRHSDYPPKHVMIALAQGPQLFVSLVSAMFRPASERDAVEDPPKDEKEERKRRAQIAFQILHAWDGYPGEGKQGPGRDSDLKEWCDAALDLVREADRYVLGQHQIGTVLSRVPKCEDDGVWPCRVARDYIEGGLVEVARGIEIARLNSRGVVTRALDEGGTQERTIAEAYQADADKIRDAYPRSAAMLDRVAESYLRQAEHEDADAEEFTDP